MPFSVSQHLGVDPEALSKAGAFDAILDVDTKRFIDPAPLEASSAPEFRAARQTIDSHFEREEGVSLAMLSIVVRTQNRQSAQSHIVGVSGSDDVSGLAVTVRPADRVSQTRGRWDISSDRSVIHRVAREIQEHAVSMLQQSSYSDGT